MTIFRAVRAAHIEIDAMLEETAGINITRYEVLCAIDGIRGATRNSIAESLCDAGITPGGIAESINWLLRKDWICQGLRTPSGVPYALTDEGARVLSGARLAAIVVEQRLINRIQAPLGGIIEALSALSTSNKNEGSDHGDCRKKESRA